MNPFATFKTWWTEASWRERALMFGGVAVLWTVIFYTLGNIDRWVESRSNQKRDAKISEQVQGDLKAAEQYGANANNAQTRREIIEPQIDDSRKRQAEARRQSNAAADRVRIAQQNYEKTLRDRPDNSDLSDAELCSRVEKLYGVDVARQHGCR